MAFAFGVPTTFLNPFFSSLECWIRLLIAALHFACFVLRDMFSPAKALAIARFPRSVSQTFAMTKMLPPSCRILMLLDVLAEPLTPRNGPPKEYA
jgi:hypothetical protein